MRDTPIKRKILVVEYNVTDLSKHEIGALELEAVAQGEASDGQGGKQYEGSTGHPAVPIISTAVVKASENRVSLSVQYNVTNFTKNEIGWLASEAVVQGEASDGHPDVNVTTKLVTRARRPVTSRWDGERGESGGR